MKHNLLKTPFRKLTLSALLLIAVIGLQAQTSVYDIISGSDDHTSLTAAIDAAGLAATLDDTSPEVQFTVFAPTNDAFDAVVAELGITISDLLASSDLSDILLYHVLDSEVMSEDLTNGLLAEPLNTANSIKVTVTSDNMYFANQAMVNGADLDADNGVVHSLDAVILSNQTVADIALGSADHSTLVAAVVQEELLPALTDPFGEFTVFAPNNAAFDALAAALETDLSGLLALENLTDVLLYHVLGAEVMSGDLTNGLLAEPLNTANSIKVTVTSDNMYFANQAMVNGADLDADNGVVHSLDAVILPNSTVADVALGSADHSTLVAAVVQEELLPALTDPFGEFTVFAPNNAAFDALAVALETDLSGLLALENLTDVLLYHVLGAEVMSGDLTNGLLAEPLNTANSIKVTVTSDDMYFANQAMVNAADLGADNGVVHSLDAVILPNQTVVDVALGSEDHTSLVAAVVARELLPALTDPFSELTVLAPTNAAFDFLAEESDFTIEEILELDELTDILLYHVFGSEIASIDISNGDVTTPLFDEYTVKFTKTTGGDVYANHAIVETPDLGAENGVVHSIDAVIAPIETVADIAIGSADHSSLVAAVVTAELLPALTNPFADYTVFAPNNDAFDDLAAALGTDVPGLLALENLADILLYHVLDGGVFSDEISNGDIVTPLNNENTIKLTVTSDSNVFINHAQVNGADLAADNGVVHSMDAVILSSATIADTVIDSEDHTTLELAVITAELLPVLTDPFTELTLFAPTDAAFIAALTELGIGAGDLLADDGLTDILLYHVVAGTVLSTDLSNGNVPTLSGSDVIVNIDNGAMINQSNVSVPNLESANGVVHVIDAVLFDTYLGVEENKLNSTLYPNPASDMVMINANEVIDYILIRDGLGRTVKEGNPASASFTLNINDLKAGQYILTLSNGDTVSTQKLIVR